MSKALILISTILLCVASVRAADQPTKFPVAGHGDLELKLSDGWTSSTIDAPRPGLPSLITLKPPADVKISVQLTPVLPPNGMAPPNDEQLKKTVERMGERMLKGAKEDHVELAEITGAYASGYVFTVTDASVHPGAFLYSTSGALRVGEMMLAVTILSNEKDSPAMDELKAMLKSARQGDKASATPAKSEPSEFRVASPDDKWDLLITAPGFKQISDDLEGKARRFSATSLDDGMELSIFLEPAAKEGDATVARDFYLAKLKQSPLPMQDIKTSGHAKAAVTTYMIPDAQQKNVNVYLSHNGIWVDVHISKIDYRENDQARIETIVKSIKIHSRVAATTKAKES